MKSLGINLLPQEIIRGKLTQKKRSASLNLSIGLLLVLLLAMGGSFWFNWRFQKELVAAQAANRGLQEKVQSFKTTEGLYRALLLKVKTFGAQEPLENDLFAIYEKSFQLQGDRVRIDGVEWSKSAGFVIGGDAESYQALSGYLVDLAQDSGTDKLTPEDILVQEASFDEEEGRVRFEIRIL